MLEKKFDAAVEQYHLAAREFVKGNPEPYKMVWSHRDDVTVGNPFGPFVRGWQQVAPTLERAASLYRDGEFAGWERIAARIRSGSMPPEGNPRATPEQRDALLRYLQDELDRPTSPSRKLSR